MMNSQEMHDKLIDYYNGHLENQEKEEFEEHLAQCPECREELAEWEEMNSALAENMDIVEPPTEMKDRVLSNVFADDSAASGTASETKQKRPKSYMKWLIPLAAALLLSLIGNFYQWMDQEDAGSLSESLIVEEGTMSLSPASESLNMDAQMSMHEDNGQNTLVLRAENFTNLDEGSVYQIWLLKDDEPFRAGTFVPNEAGDGYVVFPMTEDDDIDWDMVAITMEPSPHNNAPEGEVLMSAEF